MQPTRHKSLSARQLEKKLNAANAKQARLLDDIIAAGYGHSRMSELRSMKDAPKVVRDYLAAVDAWQELNDELRYRRWYHGSDKPVRARKQNPLKGGWSLQTISENIAAEMRKGKSQAQATAIAYKAAREAWRKRHPNGPYPEYLRTRKGNPMKLKKGSKAAKDRMAELRAMQGKKRRKKTTKKRATKRNPAKVTTRAATKRTSFFFVAKCKGADIWYLALMGSGKFRWYPTRGDALRFPTQKVAERVASMVAKRLPPEWSVFVAPDRMTFNALLKACEKAMGKH